MNYNFTKSYLGKNERETRLVRAREISSMLSIKDLKVNVDGKSILNGLNLDVLTGEVHAIMGPNGSGKSTLAHVLAGRPGYDIVSGEVFLEGENLLELKAEQRAQRGLFLAMQYPVELAGVNYVKFMRESLNAIRRFRGETDISDADFFKLMKDKASLLEFDNNLIERDVNSGFSGGEKKRNEVLQMLVLEPRLCILDETDSGLDIEALQVIAPSINSLRSTERSMIVITHYQRLLKHIEPDYVHVLIDGCIVQTGDKELAFDLEEKGYHWLIEESIT